MDNEEDFAAYHFKTLEGLDVRNVGSPIERVTKVLLQLTFAAEEPRTAVRIYPLEDLAIAAQIHPGNLGRVLDKMECGRMILNAAHDRATVIEILPEWTGWDFPYRLTDLNKARIAAAIDRLRAVAAIDPRQMQLIDPQPLEPRSMAGVFSRALVQSTTAPQEMTSPLVPSTTPERNSVVPRTSGTPFSTREGIDSTEKDPPVVLGTTRPLTLKGCTVKELNSFKAPKALKELEGSDVSEENEEPEPRSQAVIPGDDPDFKHLVDRIFLVIGPDQQRAYGGHWINRARACPRAMRVAVDRYLSDMNDAQRRAVRIPWQWLGAEYIGNAHKMKLTGQLSEKDRERRGWWSGAIRRLAKAVNLFC